jgi:hypothetical protein
VAEQKVGIDQAAAQVLAQPCSCWGGRMFVIETFEAGCQPRHRSTANEDRHLTSESATFRTPTAKGFPRGPMIRYAAARPNTSWERHFAPRAALKRIVNATQSQPIGQTSGHNYLISEPRRLPHTHSRAIKSP